MAKKVFKVNGMDCPSCAQMLELDLEDAGFKASCSFAKEELEVELKNEPADQEKIKEIVKKSGYSIV